MNVLDYNRQAWNKLVDKKDVWTLPVSSEMVDKARKGDWKIVLTPSKPVPREWFPELKHARVLCLASGGGQQGPILAALGAHVTVFDNSPKQLEQDELVAKRDNLDLRTVQGDMADLSCFADAAFDLIFHPCSNCFVPSIKPVWREAARVIRSGGVLLAGFTNPVVFSMDPVLEKQGIVQLKYKIPYSDLTSLSESERQVYVGNDEPMAFGHTLEDQIGGQLDAGFALTGFFEDSWEEAKQGPLDRLLSPYIATRAVKR